MADRLRITGGTRRGRKLRSPPANTIRPASDLVRQAVFNMLAAEIADCVFYDVFAGTGIVGMEALSRGASFVRFSDLNREPIETIKDNLKHCKFVAQSEVRRADAFTYLSAEPDRKFEYIYIAPPQYKDMWSKALELLDENIGWLAEDGWVIVQIAPREYRSAAPAIENLEEFDQRKYGSTLLVFYQRKETG